MPKYLIQASYSADGLKGLMKDKASGRKVAVDKLFASVGGKVESVYYCFGDYDVVLIADLADDAAMAAASINACSTGLVRIKTTPLLTIAETDQALGKKVPGPGEIGAERCGFPGGHVGMIMPLTLCDLLIHRLQALRMRELACAGSATGSYASMET